MIDMHSHVLPLVDDGSQDILESLEMIDMSASSGVRVLAVTPHSNQRGRFENYYRKNLLQKFRALQQEVENAGINIRLVLGMEIFSSYDLQELITNELLCGLNFSKYFLVEFPFDADLGYMYHCIHLISDAGKTPVIAHPERYTEIQRSAGILYDWIQEGVCTQVNKGSIFGHFGSAAQKTAEFLYYFDLVTCVGSDAHGTKVRTTDMAPLKEYLLENFGPDYTKKITRDNSLHMLRNQDVPLHGIRPDDLHHERSESRGKHFLRW